MTAMETGSHLWDISMTPSTSPMPSAERDAILANPGFGGNFTDNMVRAKWTADKGWHDAELVAYGPLLLDPATNFIHYGQAIFEGLKGICLHWIHFKTPLFSRTNINMARSLGYSG